MAGPFAIFHELGDPTRLTVLLAIVGGRKNVTQIVAELGLTQPQVSYHLRKLKDAGLASEEKDGRWVWYHANWETDDARVRELLDLIARWSGVPSATGGLGVARDDEPVTVERPTPSEDMDDFLL